MLYPAANTSVAINAYYIPYALLFALTLRHFVVVGRHLVWVLQDLGSNYTVVVEATCQYTIFV